MQYISYIDFGEGMVRIKKGVSKNCVYFKDSNKQQFSTQVSLEILNTITTAWGLVGMLTELVLLDQSIIEKYQFQLIVRNITNYFV